MVYGQGLNSNELNRIMIEAEQIARKKRSYTIDASHLLFALINSTNPKVEKALKGCKKEMEQKIQDHIDNQPQSTKTIDPVPNTNELNQVLNTASTLANKENSQLEEIHLLYAVLKLPVIKEILAEIDLSQIIRKLEIKEEREKHTIDDFAIDLVEVAREGKLDRVIGRDKEIRRTLEILMAKTKSNPLLLGEPGVGKTAIVNRLAQLIANNEAPGLNGCKLYSVDLGALVAGTMYHGQFEERLKTLIKETEESNRQIILFIDEIHMILGAGKTQGAMDAANLFKPGLASGKIRCIGATTYDEYKLYIEKDPAFERRFMRVSISEPSVEDTITILRGLREGFELYHGMKILNETLECAAEMGSRYISGGHMPDKAITLLDNACSSAKLSLESEPPEIMELKSKIWATELEKTAIQSDETRDHQLNIQERLEQVNAKLANLYAQMEPMEKEYQERMEHVIKRKKLQAKLEGLKAKLASAERTRNTSVAYDIKHFAIPDLEHELNSLETNDDAICIRPEHIAQVVSNLTGISVKRLTQTENQRLLQMEARLNQRVVGQSHAIESLVNAILRNKAGFSRPNKPIGSFLLLGPTGVGKTQLAKSLAVELFDDEKAMVRIDMSEYLEQHSVSRLIGAPPGYIGYESGGYLTEKIRNRPYSIILIDEIEKADKKVANLFLQILDDGRLTDGKGRTINFSNTVILMTSNIGSEMLLENASNKEAAIEALKRHFPPEFINRVDGVEVFNPLTQENLEDIVQIYLAEINQRLVKNGIYFHLKPSAIQRIIQESYTPEYGARPIQRYIEQTITTDISKIYLSYNQKDKLFLYATSNDDTSVNAHPYYTGSIFNYYQDTTEQHTPKKTKASSPH
ncbi:ATP-dependent Clp protease ATP-binding subunit ClpB [Nematocida sp. AWRm80]|nr:ATP-dependent Clp protease ATP-binding subunit ClpB [Nematocida sp. AWRm80]